MTIDTSKLAKLDCIAAKLYDQIMAKNGDVDEEELIDLLNTQEAQIRGKIKRNEHSFMLLFSDNSVLRVDCFIDEHGSNIDLYVGQYEKDDSGKLKEIDTGISLQPSSNSVN